MNSTTDSKTSNMTLIVFYLDCFGDKHIGFLLQIVICSSTGKWLITFSVDEYHRIFFFKLFL